jgi:hypothetical protein
VKIILLFIIFPIPEILSGIENHWNFDVLILKYNREIEINQASLKLL